MSKQPILIEAIPAMLWGEPSDSVYLFVHGRHSRKEEAAGFAAVAGSRGCQVVSFDLPEHGGRMAEDYPCTVQNAVRDLGIVHEFITGKWKNISLFGASLGAYFSLVAYREATFQKCLFQSPILDMQDLIRSMMQWFGVSEDQLRERQEISTPMGETLSWPYYEFVRANPIVKWDSPTYILYGSKDNLTPPHVVEAFVEKFHCRLEVVRDGEHYFHTPEQVAAVAQWLEASI
jgi:pimeloyl-ACP methyl ester carboxylesterase